MAIPSSVVWDDGLVGTPRRIAEADVSPLRVLAGPGTGKTFCLMRRVARLLQLGNSPERILVVTFTRTSATDLRRELDKLGVAGADRVQAGTLHSFCYRLLQDEDVLEMTNRIPRPLLAFEERFLLEDLKREGRGNVAKCRKNLEAFAAAWARLQTDEPGWPTNPEDRCFHTSLLGWLRFHRAMLVGELVPESLRFLRDNPLSPVLKKFDHVLVDEFQDLNKAEQTLVTFVAQHGSLTIIGDENQSIYSFKHAHPEGITEFAQSHPDTHDETLDECRRCPSRVVSIANALISNNQVRAQHVLRPFAGNPDGEVRIVQWADPQAEAERLAEFISMRIRSGEVCPGEVLVLSPGRQFGYQIRDALNSLGIYARSYFQEEALEGDPKDASSSHAQQSLTLLNLLVNPDDRVSLRCWVGFGSQNLRSPAWGRLRSICEASSESPRQALERLSAEDLSIANGQQLVCRYQYLLERIGELADKKGGELLDCLFPPDEDWAEPFRTVAVGIQEDSFSAAKLLDHLRQAITQPELPTEADYVRVMSLHKSKGLTADLVVVTGCIEGILPRSERSAPQVQQERMLEEQRRLFYVALTRARRTLVLSSVTRLPRAYAHRMGARIVGNDPKWSKVLASQFLAELGSSRPLSEAGPRLLVSAI